MALAARVAMLMLEHVTQTDVLLVAREPADVAVVVGALAVGADMQQQVSGVEIEPAANRARVRRELVHGTARRVIRRGLIADVA